MIKIWKGKKQNKTNTNSASVTSMRKETKAVDTSLQSDSSEHYYKKESNERTFYSYNENNKMLSPFNIIDNFRDDYGQNSSVKERKSSQKKSYASPSAISLELSPSSKRSLSSGSKYSSNSKSK